MTKDWAHGVGHSPVCQTLLQIIVRAMITSSPLTWTSSAGMLSTLADFPFISNYTAASPSIRVVVLCVCLFTVQYWWIFIGLVIVQLRAVFCPSVQYLCFFCETFSWTFLDSSSFPLFHSGQAFHEFVRPFSVVLPQIFFSLTTQFSRCVWSGTLTHYNASMHVFSYVLEHSCIIDKALFFMSLVLLYNVSYSSRSLELDFQATENCNLFLFLLFFCSTSHSA